MEDLSKLRSLIEEKEQARRLLWNLEYQKVATLAEARTLQREVGLVDPDDDDEAPNLAAESDTVQKMNLDIRSAREHLENVCKLIGDELGKLARARAVANMRQVTVTIAETDAPALATASA